jgi:hypothetical protein
VTRRNPLVTSILTLYGIFVECLRSRPLWYGVRRLDVKDCEDQWSEDVLCTESGFAFAKPLSKPFGLTWFGKMEKRPHVPAMLCEGV